MLAILMTADMSLTAKVVRDWEVLSTHSYNPGLEGTQPWRRFGGGKVQVMTEVPLLYRFHFRGGDWESLAILQFLAPGSPGTAQTLL